MQLSKNIYRNTYNIAHKHKPFLGHFMKEWHYRAHVDNIYKMALKGSLDGLTSNEAKADVSFFDIPKNITSCSEFDEIIVNVYTFIRNYEISSWAKKFELENFSVELRSDWMLRNQSTNLQDKFKNRLSQQSIKFENWI